MKLYKRVEGKGICECEYPCSCDTPRYERADLEDVYSALRYEVRRYQEELNEHAKDRYGKG